MSQRGQSPTAHSTAPATYGLQIPTRSNIAPAAGGPSTRATAVGRLLEAQCFATPAGGRVLGDERRDRRRGDSLTEREQQRARRSDTGHTLATASDGETGDEQAEADGEQPLRAVPLDERGRTPHPGSSPARDRRRGRPRPTRPRSRPKRRSPNSENVASNAVKATIVTKPMTARRRSIGDAGVHDHVAVGDRAA